MLQPYPDYDESKLSRKEVEFVVQVGSKIRGKISLPLDTEQAAAESMAKGDTNVSKFLEGQTVKKVVFVKNKLINFIV